MNATQRHTDMLMHVYVIISIYTVAHTSSMPRSDRQDM